MSLVGCAADSSTVAAFAAAPPRPTAEIASIRLLVFGSGHTRQEWGFHRIEITPQLTTSDRASGREPRVRTEGRTSSYEWPRLCQLIDESGLFAVQGETILGGGFHALNAEVTITYADGTESIVSHGFFHAAGQLPFWTVVRVIEGSALDALPLAEAPAFR